MRNFELDQQIKNYHLFKSYITQDSDKKTIETWLSLMANIELLLGTQTSGKAVDKSLVEQVQQATELQLAVNQILLFEVIIPSTDFPPPARQPAIDGKEAFKQQFVLINKIMSDEFEQLTASSDSLKTKKQPPKPKPSHTMNGVEIDHVVVLMLENRGFDHVLGYLYDQKQPPQQSYPTKIPKNQQNLRGFEGMDGLNPATLVNSYNFNYYTLETEMDIYGEPIIVKVPHHIEGKVSPQKGARACNIPRTNPHEDFIHIYQDMYGKDVVPDFTAMKDKTTRNQLIAGKVPQMTGWAQNFCDGIRHHRGEADTVLTKSLVSEILDIYLPDQLPILSGLARSYAVSDLWFCSVPSQTNTNRAFWAAGTAAGLVTNDYYPTFPKIDYVMPLASDTLPEGEDANGIPYRRSMFDVLEQQEKSWKYYRSMSYPVSPYAYFTNMFPQFNDDKKYGKNLPMISEFYQDVKDGTLPQVTYIEPLWSGGKSWEGKHIPPRVVGNEFHPVCDMTCGEFFLKEVYEALVNSKKWDKTLFVITFDENGGTYDHFAPWKATPSGRDPVDGSQFGFAFDQFGVRVPTLLISKHIKPQTLFRSPTEVPFDHTSVISSILEWLDIDRKWWRLGDRVAKAPVFNGVLQNNTKDDSHRSRSALGMAQFDVTRQTRIAKLKPLTAKDDVYLQYIGSKWPQTAIGDCYLGGPVTSLNYWYPNCTATTDDALKFKLIPDNGHVTSGSPLLLEVGEGKAKGYSLAAPEMVGFSHIYLYGGKKPSKWVIWLLNDRNEDQPLYDGDEVIVFSERYLPQNLKTGGVVYDPFQRLTVDLSAKSHKDRYVQWRAGEWDIWKIKKA